MAALKYNIYSHICALLLCIILNVSQSQQVSVAFNSDIEGPKVEQESTAAILEMLQTSIVMERHKQVFNLYVRASQADNLVFFGDIIDALMLAVGEQIAVRIGVQQHINGDNERHYSVLLVDSTESLRLLYEELLKYHLNVMGYYIILLYNPHSHYSDDLYSAVQLNWKVGVVDANILIHALPDLVLLFTGFPYTRFHCAAVAPVITNKFVGGRWQHKHFFPDKIGNIHGCTLVCATWEDLPYFKVQLNDKTSREEYVGIEGKVLQHLKESFNFNVGFLWMSDEEIDQTPEDDGYIFHKLFVKGAEFSIGAYFYKPTTNSEPYAPTTGYYSSTFNFVVNSKARPYSFFTKLLFPFLKELWLLLVIVFLVGIIVILVAGCLNTSLRNFIMGNNNNTPIYNMFVVALGGGVVVLPHRNFARFLFFLWILTSLILRSSYQALLYHFIRADINMPPPKSVADIHAQNFSVMMTNFTWSAIEDLPLIRARSKIFNATQYESFKMLKDAKTAAANVAILTPFEYFGYYKRNNLNNADLYVVPERVFTQQLSIYMRKNSIFLPGFNQRILNFNSMGLLKKAEADFVDTDPKTYDAVGGSEQPQPITLNHLYGSNVILMCGCCLGAITLVFELMVSSAGRWFRRNRAEFGGRGVHSYID